MSVKVVSTSYSLCHKTITAFLPACCTAHELQGIIDNFGETV